MAQNREIAELGQIVTVDTSANSMTVNGSIILGNSSSNVVINSTAISFGGTNQTDKSYTWTNTHTFTNTVSIAALSANGTLGLSSQVLTTNGSGIYWSSAGVNVNATYTWSNTQTFSNTITFSSVINGTANAANYLGNSSGTIDNVSSWITTNASAAYTNAVSYTDGKILTANSAITGNADSAYTNATIFASNASNVNTGTLAEARLPYRMNQNVRNTDTVEFGGMTLTGNLVVSGNVNIIGANNLSISDNMIYLNSNNDVSNPDLGFAGNYNDGAYAHAGFFRDASDGIWKVFDNYAPEPDANVYIDTTNTSFHLANFQANNLNAGNTSINWFIANTGGAYVTGTVNATTISTGSVNVVNSSGLTTTANVNIGSAGELILTAGAGIYANGGLGTAGHVLHSNGTSVYWAADDNSGGTVTSVATGNGLTGGTITTTGTISVVAGTGAVVNATGVHVNSTYIGTLTANNATFAFGLSAASTTATGSTVVTRDVNGDFNGRYINASYHNSSDDINTGTISHIMAKFGDNYHRSATAAKVASFISGQSMNISGSATNATYATSAGSATNASAATNATYATSAGSATNATYATSAGSATNASAATNATYATSAGSATNATFATSAGSLSSYTQIFQSSVVGTNSTDRTLNGDSGWVNHMSITFTTTKVGPIFCRIVLALSHENGNVYGAGQFVLSGPTTGTSQFMAVANQLTANKAGGSHSMNWIFPSCAVGSYTLYWQARNFNGGTTWILNNYNGFDTLFCNYI